MLTSGTMSDGVDFSFFEKENGIHQIAKMFRQTSMTASPFDYKNHTRLYMPTGIPLPENNSPEYIAAISDEIVKIVKATNGHAAILFTSYKVLEAVYRQTKDRLTQYELIRMTRSNKSAIADFKKSKNGVLFASGSMWEGVDCIGDCLSSVIIPRLPFPMRSATMESKKEECNGLGEFVNIIATRRKESKHGNSNRHLPRDRQAGGTQKSRCILPCFDELCRSAEFLQHTGPLLYPIHKIENGMDSRGYLCR